MSQNLHRLRPKRGWTSSWCGGPLGHEKACQPFFTLRQAVRLGQFLPNAQNDFRAQIYEIVFTERISLLGEAISDLT